MPLESMPIILRGGRLRIATTVLPTSSSGLVVLVRCRRGSGGRCRVPSSSVKRRSLSRLFHRPRSLRTLHDAHVALAKSRRSSHPAARAQTSARRAASFAALSASSSASSLAMSMRGKSVSPLCTVTSAGSTPHDGGIVPAWSALPRAPICAKAFAQLSGMKGSSSVTADAQRLEQVIQHAWPGARLFALVLGERPRAPSRRYTCWRGEMTLNTSLERVLRAGTCPSSRHTCSRSAEDAMAISSSSSASCLALGRQRAAEVLDRPWRRRAAETRLPRSLARSVLMRGDEQLVGEVAVRAEGELAQEEIAQRVHAVALGEHVRGRRRCPSTCDILPPSDARSQPWPKTCLGSGMPMLMSMAGQMMEWKRTISLPTMCTSAGQYFS